MIDPITVAPITSAVAQAAQAAQATPSSTSPVVLVLSSLGVLGALLLAYLAGRRTAAPVVAPTTPVQVAEEDKAQAKIDEAQEKHDQATSKAAEERKEALDTQTEEQARQAPALIADGEALNKHLIDVGREMREP